VKLEEAARRPLTYPDVGATGADVVPAGYHRLELTQQIGVGRAAFDRAVDALFSWDMHRGVGATVEASAPRADIGVTMVSTLHLGPLRMAAPCRVVWTSHEESAAGFAYGTVEGHPVRGEERFVIALADERVRLQVRAVSRAGTWYMRLGGPLPRYFQHVLARRYATALARIVASGGSRSAST
jgi:uncharacterized protein (UPF0548 family)